MLLLVKMLNVGYARHETCVPALMSGSETTTSELKIIRRRDELV